MVTKKQAKLQRWVVKAGSQMVCSGGPLLIKAWMAQVAELRTRFGIETVWVTSGAIATGRDRVELKKARSSWSLDEKQALSAIGQPMIQDLYNLALQATGRFGAQILLTADDLKSKSRRKNFQSTLQRLLAWGITPVLNENDAVATEEIRFGDNDHLSAVVAEAVRADRLVILTDVDGLYDSDPHKNADARLVTQLTGISPTWLKRVAQKAGSDRGTGGMFTKLTAARKAGASGIETWLARGDRPQVLLDVAKNQAVGTRILPRG